MHQSVRKPTPGIEALIGILLLGVACPLTAQQPPPCGWSSSVGLAAPAAERNVSDPAHADRRTTTEVLDPGLALEVEIDCPLGGPWRVTAGGERLNLEDVVLWHFTAAVGLRIELVPRLALFARAGGGWRHSGRPNLVLPDIMYDSLDYLRLGDDGPVARGDVAVVFQVTPGVDLFADVGGRVDWFDRRRVEGDTDRVESEPVHVFPITGGLSLRF